MHMQKIFKLTTYGESHGEAIGGIIDGCPAGIIIDFEAIRTELQRRKPGQSSIVTQRKEEDEVQFLSGIFEGKITVSVKNKNQLEKLTESIKKIEGIDKIDRIYKN